MISVEEISKYKAAGMVAQTVLTQLAALCLPGKNVMQLCERGDQLIQEELGKCPICLDGAFIGGVAFPTCISVDNVICHFSPCPLDGEVTEQTLRQNALVKIELGVHVDGYPALIGKSFICTNDAADEKSDSDLSCKRRLIEAAHEISQSVMALFQLTQTDSLTGECCSLADNYKFNEVVCELAAKQSLTAVQGALSYQIGRNSLDMPKQIPVNLPDKERQRVPRFKFCSGECYVIDIVLSSGDGKIRTSPIKPSIFRLLPTKYNLKLATSRAAFAELSKRAGSFPFNIRNAADPKRMRMGMHECVSHACTSPSEVLVEKDTSFVGRFLYTILLTKEGPLLITTAEK